MKREGRKRSLRKRFLLRGPGAGPVVEGARVVGVGCAALVRSC